MTVAARFHVVPRPSSRVVDRQVVRNDSPSAVPKTVVVEIFCWPYRRPSAAGNVTDPPGRRDANSTARASSSPNSPPRAVEPGQSTSMTMAVPIPPPAHIDSTPMPPPRRRSS